ncbi:MAG: hypothetical protein JXJ17_08515 [Anaerolineae bacterium]|nr:hypothetical protein [Anaerolineae bacterium]
MTDATENQILMQAFGFSADDLDANRSGSLTPVQAEKLRKLRRSPLIQQSVSLMLSLVLFAFVMLWEMTLLFKGFLIFVFVVSVLYEGRTILRLWLGVSRDGREMQVEAIEGPLTILAPAIKMPMTTYRANIGREDFSVTWEQVGALRELAEGEVTARVYYAAHSRFPVSIELVEQKS